MTAFGAQLTFEVRLEPSSESNKGLSDAPTTWACDGVSAGGQLCADHARYSAEDGSEYSNYSAE